MGNGNDAGGWLPSSPARGRSRGKPPPAAPARVKRGPGRPRKVVKDEPEEDEDEDYEDRESTLPPKRARGFGGNRARNDAVVAPLSTGRRTIRKPRHADSSETEHDDGSDAGLGRHGSGHEPRQTPYSGHAVYNVAAAEDAAARTAAAQGAAAARTAFDLFQDASDGLHGNANGHAPAPYDNAAHDPYNSFLINPSASASMQPNAPFPGTLGGAWPTQPYNYRHGDPLEHPNMQMYQQDLRPMSNFQGGGMFQMPGHTQPYDQQPGPSMTYSQKQQYLSELQAAKIGRAHV